MIFSLNFTHAQLVHVGDGRQLHLLDALLGDALDDAQHVPLARAHEQDRVAAAAGAAGAADAMDVGLGVVRNVVVDDVRDALDVEAARGDVGRDQDVDLAVLEPRDGLLALALLHVAVQRGRGEAARLEALRELDGLDLGAHEHQHGVELLGFEQRA